MQASEFIAERLKRHHTQASLAKALGYSVRQVQRWESGEYEVPALVAWAIRYAVQSRNFYQSGRKK
jgi:transcriptional regulator with XRE-family HTH domain